MGKYTKFLEELVLFRISSLNKVILLKLIYKSNAILIKNLKKFLEMLKVNPKIPLEEHIPEIFEKEE